MEKGSYMMNAVLFVAVFMLSGHALARAARSTGKSGNINCIGNCMGSVNVAAGWTKCRRVSGNGTFWISPYTGGCEHWSTPYCNLTSGYKISNAPRSACPK